MLPAVPVLPPAPRPPPGAASRPSDLRQQAQALETAFLAEMLRTAGTARMQGHPAEGGRDLPFDTFLAEAQARALMAGGGLGLTESLVRSLLRAEQGGAP